MAEVTNTERSNDQDLVERLAAKLSEESGSDEPEARGGPEDEPDTGAAELPLQGTLEEEPEDFSTEEAPESAEEEPLDYEDESEAEPEPNRYKVLVDGETREVTFDELLRGYSGTEVFTQRTQEAAELAKHAEQSRTHANALAGEYEQALNILREQVSAQTPEPPADNAPDREWGTYLREKAKLDEIDKHVGEFQQFRQVEVQQQLAELKAVEGQKLLQAMPHWRDPEIATKERGKLVRYAHTIGMTDSDISGLYDHRAVVMIDKARRYDELMEKSKGARGKAQAAPTLKPGAAKAQPTRRASKRRDVDQARERFQKSTGRGELAAAADLVRHTGIID